MLKEKKMRGNSHFKEGYTKEIKISKLTHFTFRLIKKYKFLRNFKMFAKYKIIMSLPKKGKVLDVGCGDGINLKVINFLRPDLELYGVDISDKKNFLSKNVNFEIMSGDTLISTEGCSLENIIEFIFKLPLIELSDYKLVYNRKEIKAYNNK